MRYTDMIEGVEVSGFDKTLSGDMVMQIAELAQEGSNWHDGTVFNINEATVLTADGRRQDTGFPGPMNVGAFITPASGLFYPDVTADYGRIGASYFRETQPHHLELAKVFLGMYRFAEPDEVDALDIYAAVDPPINLWTIEQGRWATVDDWPYTVLPNNVTNSPPNTQQYLVHKGYGKNARSFYPATAAVVQVNFKQQGNTREV